MKSAIALAESRRPESEHIPKVGAIIAVDGVVIGKGQRGPGSPEDDQHAEKKQLHKATVYTTLEPCTPTVRSDPDDCCTERLRRAGVKICAMRDTDKRRPQDARTPTLAHTRHSGKEAGEC
jgi:pyrimidine deaminase RibD-like protein